MKLKIEKIPTRTEVVYEWDAVVERVRAKGPMIVGPDTNTNSAHACLHKHGIGVYQIKVGDKIVAYSIEPLRSRRTKP